MAMLTDGHPTTIDFAANPTIKLYERTVTPPSIEAGGEINITTMLNVAWRTKAPKHLKDLGEMSVTALYDPAVYPQARDMIGVNQLITINWPDDSTLGFWGWLDSFTPGEVSEGEAPECDLTVIASNRNDSGVETGPVYTPPP